MSGQISIESINKDGKSVAINYVVTGEATRYFRANRMLVHYPFDSIDIPESVLVVPFVANVLPIVWMANAKLIVPMLDEAFSNCIPNVKIGYETMYPNVHFRGEVVVGSIQKNIGVAATKSAMFYSGGVDSVDTFVRHIDELPDLLTVWGSDIKYDNKDGWDIVHSVVEHTARRFKCAEYVIRSEFRECVNEAVLTSDFGAILHDGWWHGVQHGLGLLGHVAPLAYVNGYKKMYIASTFTTTAITCASSPLTDNQVRFVDCQVYHDGFECTRQNKIENVVKYSKENKISFPLHVCWRSQTGENCCVCEKCLRTLTALLSIGADPDAYGFVGYRKSFDVAKNKRTIRKSLFDDRQVGNNAEFWAQISDALKKVTVNDSAFPEETIRFVKWVRDFDFRNKKNWDLPIDIIVRQKMCRIRRAAFKLIDIVLLRRKKHVGV